jgi:hypothetical protein
VLQPAAGGGKECFGDELETRYDILYYTENIKLISNVVRVGFPPKLISTFDEFFKFVKLFMASSVVFNSK